MDVRYQETLKKVKNLVENQEHRAAVPHVKSNYWTKTNHQHKNESFKTWGRNSQIYRAGSTESLSQAVLPLLTQGAGGERLSKLCQLKGMDPSPDTACHEAPAPAAGCQHTVHGLQKGTGSTRNQAHEMLFLTTAHSGAEGLSRHIAGGWDSILRECYHMFISFLSSPLAADTALGHCLKGSTR